jgi:acetyltransferase-like isoleucine patch superfamily enzyme
LNIIIADKLVFKNANIGNLNFINVKSITIKEKASIGSFNKIKNINNLYLDSRSTIRSKNFIGGPEQGHPIKDTDMSLQNLYVGKSSSILRKNYFDVVREIRIGDDVIFAGQGSQIWTHGFDCNRQFYCGNVTLSNKIFIGSNCILTKGITICSETTISSGSVIYKNILESGFYSTNQLVKIS